MAGDIVFHLPFFYFALLAALSFVFLNVPPTYALTASLVPSKSCWWQHLPQGAFKEQQTGLISGTSRLQEPQHRQEEHQH